MSSYNLAAPTPSDAPENLTAQIKGLKRVAAANRAKSTLAGGPVANTPKSNAASGFYQHNN